MLIALFLVPLAFAALAAVVLDRARPWLLPIGGIANLALVLHAVARRPPPALEGWLLLDDLGALFMSVVAVVFCICAIYAAGYLRVRAERRNRIFCACLFAFLAMMNLMIEAHHLGLMWVALESCTLASAPLLFFNRSPKSLEAVWKYLLVGSVGIAIALLGSFFLAYSALQVSLRPSLLLEDLLHHAGQLSRPWLRTAFVFLFIGYGTKMGLAPLHTWKPDAYGEAPGLVGALLAGGLTNCAFLAILRFYKICAAAGEAGLARELMIGIGLFSMLVAGVFMARQADYKRLLAYSSIEHMGILVVGIGIGGTSVFGSMFHVVNNGLTKGALFLAAANIHRAFASKRVDQVHGAMRRLPISGTLFLLGFLAITGSPPFGPFVSELAILNGAIAGGHYVIAAIFVVLLLLVFSGMGATVLAVTQGSVPEEMEPPRERWLLAAPPALFLLVSLVLGIYQPAPVHDLVMAAAASMSAR